MNQRTLEPQTVVVLGAGNFGTCLANHLANLGHDVKLWARSDDVVKTINKTHKNPKYLSAITLSPSLQAINSIELKQLHKVDAVIIATPMQAMRQVLVEFKQLILESRHLICSVKGIEIDTKKLPNQIYDEIFGKTISEQCVILSGPSFAIEVAEKLPTAVVAASKSKAKADYVQKLFHTPEFRVYTSDDPIGLEVAGAIKNVIAIAAGACAGLGFQMNSQAALITRGLAEMMRIGMRLGANPLTFQGLGGVGDLFLTCSSHKSRNYSLGFKIGQGLSVSDALKSLDSVSEGYTTAKAAYDLAVELVVDAPITSQVFNVLYLDRPIKLAVKELVSRDAKPEFGSTQMKNHQ